MIIKKKEFINALDLLIKSNSDEQDGSYILSQKNIKHISEEMYLWYIDGGDKPKFKSGDPVSFASAKESETTLYYIIGNAHQDKDIWMLTTKRDSRICECIGFSKELILR